MLKGVKFSEPAAANRQSALPYLCLDGGYATLAKLPTKHPPEINEKQLKKKCSYNINRIYVLNSNNKLRKTLNTLALNTLKDYIATPHAIFLSPIQPTANGDASTLTRSETMLPVIQSSPESPVTKHSKGLLKKIRKGSTVHPQAGLKVEEKKTISEPSFSLSVVNFAPNSCKARNLMLGRHASNPGGMFSTESIVSVTAEPLKGAVNMQSRRNIAIQAGLLSEPIRRNPTKAGSKQAVRVGTLHTLH